MAKDPSTHQLMMFGLFPHEVTMDGVALNSRAWVFSSLVLLGWFLVVHVLIILQRQKPRAFSFHLVYFGLRTPRRSAVLWNNPMHPS